MSERREWWIDNELDVWEWRENAEDWMRESGVLDEDTQPIHVREVLPDDQSPEWVDELIRLCSRTGGHPNEYRYDIHEHLAKRGER